MKLCSLSSYPPKPNAMTSAVYLNTEIEKLHPIDVHKWNYIGLWKTTIAPIMDFSSLKKTCKEHDIVHVQYDLGGYMPLFLPMLWLARMGTNCKIVLTVHEEFDNVPLRWLVVKYHDLWYRIADKIIVHSPMQKHNLPSGLHSRTAVQHHGVIYREDVNRSPKKDTILLPGFINAWKGHDVALYAISEVKREIPEVKLYIVGKPHDKKFTERMQELVKSLHITENVIWELGYVPEDKFLEYYRTSAIALLPYKRITMSGILAHILSWRLPTIMSDLPVFEWFTNNRGIYFRNGDPHSLATKIIHLLRDTKRQEKMSHDFGVLAREYSWEEEALKTLEIYHELVPQEEAPEENPPHHDQHIKG